MKEKPRSQLIQIFRARLNPYVPLLWGDNDYKLSCMLVLLVQPTDGESTARDFAIG
jgi:hypothetical protein